MLATAFATLTLVLTDVQSRPIDLGVLRSSTEAALAGSGLTLRWDRAEPRIGLDSRQHETRVILLSRHPIPRANESVLGAVFRDPTRSRAIWLYVDAVHRVTQTPGGRQAHGSAVRELSVALGRVLAHEIAHILAPSRPHSDEGLMARAVDRSVLRHEAGPLDAACLDAIRVAVAEAAAPSLPVSDAGVSSIPGDLAVRRPQESLAPAF